MKINKDSTVHNKFPHSGDGITIRQHFACHAMQAILSTVKTENLRFSLESVIPILAVKYADMLIEELNESENEKRN